MSAPEDGPLKTPASCILAPPPIDKAVLSFKRYFGLCPGGANLLGAIETAPAEQLETLVAALKKVQAGKGRVFAMGNGGSFDNAQLLVAACEAAGLRAKAPGNPNSYLRGDYSRIFKIGLEQDGVGPDDLVLGLSGSGNSPNVLHAFTFARMRGAPVFALGGRDGGQMAKLATPERSLIFNTNSMEAIEDAHYAAALIATHALRRGVPVTEAQLNLTRSLRADLTEKNLSALARFALSALRSVYDETRLFVAGLGLGAGHVIADAGRGWSNAVPLRGVCAPMPYTTNSYMATLNDDGAFGLIDGFVKYNPGAGDVALLLQFPGDEHEMAAVREWFAPQGVEMFIVGQGADIDFGRYLKTDFCPEFLAAMIGHAAGEVVRAVLWQQFGVRRLETAEQQVDFKGQKKLIASEQQELRAKLTAEGVIQPDEVPTFMYGHVYAAKDPAVFGRRWVPY